MDPGSAPPFPEDLTFTGGSLEECERFIVAVRRHAVAAGRLRDSEWIADRVSCCFAGDALQWHMCLPPDVAHDWTQLQLALLDRYSGTAVRQPLHFSSPDLPAPPSVVKSSTSATIRSDSRVGRIKIEHSKSNPREPDLWVTTSVNGSGSPTPEHQLYRDSAVRVRFLPSNRPHNLHFTSRFAVSHPGKEQNKEWYYGSLLGITRVFNAGSNELGSDERFILAVTNVSHTDASNNLYGYGETLSAVWTVSEDNTISVTWNGVALTPSMWPSGDTLLFVIDEKVFRERYYPSARDKLVKVRLSFDESQ